MDVKAIVLVGPGAAEGSAREQVAGVPIPLLDVLGRPLLHRVVDRLRRSVDEIAVIVEGGEGDAETFARLITSTAALPGVKATVMPAGGDMWRAAEEAFSDFAQNGAEVVVAIRLGPYAELDYDHLVQFHLDRGARVTAAVHEESEFGVFAISASRRNDAAYLFRHRFLECREPCTQYPFAGYFNQLAGAADLRALTRDGLLQMNTLRPVGKEIKPGVWAGEGARIDRGARVLTPAFIGARSRVRTAAVLTRCSSVEHHAEVDCGTVVEDSSVLPFSYVGAGLDLAHAVVGFRRLVSLRRNTEVEFSDPTLIAMSSVHAPVRALASAASLATFLPKHILLGFFGKSRREKPADLPAAVRAPAAHNLPALENGADDGSAKFPSNLAVARRYGNE
ncbi:MAG: hypothetical protein HYX28_09875 [Candidatus Koribacter versatilis]|uniref:Nucleotidyl transferase n=1 Tax=Candidatus Korobacter versatilis TaxID=658062 RepID=A0A932EQC0_9BACT|nr:hypothetical protein [Candidatus Koribacter versatilis]